MLDLDGVMWLGESPIAGSSEAVAKLRRFGHDVAFCTNNSSERVADFEAKLARFGIDGRNDVITSAAAAATLVEPGERAMVCGGDGVVEALLGRGATVGLSADRPPAGSAVGTSAGDVDVVVVGFHRSFDYGSMKRASRAVMDGARLLATNDDPIYPSSDGPAPGCGSILASIERASGGTAVVAGKPNPPMAALLVGRFGSDSVFVGDSLGTDGAMADRLGWPFGLVLTGNVGAEDVPAAHPRDWLAADLAALVELRYGDSGH